MARRESGWRTAAAQNRLGHHLPDQRTQGPAVRGALSGWRLGRAGGNLPAMTTPPNPYRGFRYPVEVIQHAVWLYHCFSPSLRDVELILAA